MGRLVSSDHGPVGPLTPYKFFMLFFFGRARLEARVTFRNSGDLEGLEPKGGEPVAKLLGPLCIFNGTGRGVGVIDNCLS